MKKALIMSLLGTTASLAMVASSNAAGSIFFQNYASGTGGVNAPVTFGSSGYFVTGGNGLSVAGYGLGHEFTADLLYSLDGGNTYTKLTFANSGVSAPLEGQFGGYPVPFGFFSNTADGPVPSAGNVYSSGAAAGYFFGDAVEIPSYTSGPIWFIVRAYNGPSYDDTIGYGLLRGQSDPFEISSLATGIQLAGNMTTMQPFALYLVPEPATLAFGGLGLAALMLFRRKNQS